MPDQLGADPRLVAGIAGELRRPELPPLTVLCTHTIEGWFALLERRALRRGPFTSVAELRAEIRRFIAAHNTYAAKPFRWTTAAAVILETVKRAEHALRIKSARH